MPILASLGLSNKKAFGFANGDQIGFDLPSSITDNALMILDASDPLSYSSGNTWYDISGNNNNASLGGTPNLSGSGGNKYFTASGTNTISLPSAVTTGSFTYLIVGSLSDGAVTNSYWRTGHMLYNGDVLFIPRFGSGSDSGAGIGHWNSNAIWHATFNGTTTDFQITTRQGGSAKYYTSVRSTYGGSGTYVNSSALINAGEIKLIIVYQTPPTVNTAYNALHTRFGL